MKKSYLNEGVLTWEGSKVRKIQERGNLFVERELQVEHESMQRVEEEEVDDGGERLHDKGKRKKQKTTNKEQQGKSALGLLPLELMELLELKIYKEYYDVEKEDRDKNIRGEHVSQDGDSSGRTKEGQLDDDDDVAGN